MAAVQLRALLQHLRRLVGPPGNGGLTDAHLLERFVNERDEAAFEVLVWRHGPMVLSLCRRVLRQEQDAEDAFQATFLTLVRKARSIGKRQAVASWLYKVAYRIALEAKTLASKRKVREKQNMGTLLTKESQQATDTAVWRELRAVLDEEVNRLPEKYRTPLVLCYFQGKTYEEVARELGCPKGTVSIRLMRAREMLRPRLARRGLSLSGGMLAAMLSENASVSAVSNSLVEGTVKAALLFAAGKTTGGLLSGQAVALTEGVLKAMFMTKLKIAAAVLLVVGMTGSGAGVLTYGSGAGDQAGPQAEKLPTPPAVEPQDQKEKPIRPVVRTKEDKLKAADAARRTRLEQEQLAIAEQQYQDQERRWTKELVEARLRLMEAEERLRMFDRGGNPESEKAYSELMTARDALRQAEQYYSDKNHPRLNQYRESLRTLQLEWQEAVKRHAPELARVRREFLEADEGLRFLERMQAVQREKVLRELQGADERVSRIQDLSSRGDPAKQGSVELEIKVDRLLREIAELRRELRRQPTDKSHQAAPERRPDQP